MGLVRMAFALTVGRYLAEDDVEGNPPVGQTVPQSVFTGVICGISLLIFTSNL